MGHVAPVISLALIAASLIFSQPPDVVFGNTKPTPATVQPGILVIADSLVENQWPKSLKFVNAPTDQQSLMPSQCVRFGIVATGDDRDELLQNSKLSFEIKFAGQSKVLLPESAAMIKQVKPEGWDFVANGLSVAGIRNTLFSSASLAVSNAGWCVPPNTQDGTANITGNVAAVAGKNVSLRSRSIQVTTLETARKRSPFKDEQSFSAWLQHYHSSPDPAQLLPGIRFVAAREKWTVMPNVAIFFVEALKAYPSACNELLQRVAREDRAVRFYAMPLLSQAGFLTGANWERLTTEERANISSHLLPDAFDVFDAKPDPGRMKRLDMLWGIFFATGDLKPVRAVVRMLAWHNDYASLSKLIESGQKPTELTESVMRGVMYRGAGWSLRSLSLEDGLLADYIDYLRSATETPDHLKQELASLNTNPAFDLK